MDMSVMTTHLAAWTSVRTISSWTRTINLTGIRSRSKLEHQLQMEAVKVGLVFSHGVIELGLESDRVGEIVTCTERGAVTKVEVIEDAAYVRVDVLVAEVRPKAVKLFRYLGVESGRFV
jgi:hypothetical protein